MKKTQNVIKELFPYIYIFGSFGLLDAWLRVMTRWIGAYSIYEIAPNLFTVLWVAILTVLVTIPKSQKVGRIIYGVTYYLFLIYTVVQYVAYLMLGKFLYVSDVLFAGEGAGYASYVLNFISLSLIVQILLLIMVGIIGVLIYPTSCELCIGKVKSTLVHGGIIVSCVVGIALTPRLYGSTSGEWNDFSNPAFEYERFVNPNFDMELTGMYQYLVRDCQMQISRKLAKVTADTSEIDGFFADKTEHSENSLTGIFEGKNLIVVMLESIDDWVITEADTPTLWRLMHEGINFTNMYTPQYANGYTFNTEFAFNTSTYPYSNGNVTYALANNDFSKSVASAFSKGGYRVNSFHEGGATFYNRGSMHEAFGYERYHSYRDYPDIGTSVLVDTYLVECDGLYQDVVSGEPFFSFVISYSAHLSYTDEDYLAQIALEKYPQYDVREDREVSILRAKARLTDDMFAGLLDRLEEDGLLEDTVIVAYTDHYSYGLTDTDRLQELSEEAGSSILERTPAFVYCADFDTPMTVDKVMQITDLGPTLMNLFGLEVPGEMMGQDIFDENYPGYVIFPNNTWLTNTTYVKNGVVQWNEGMSDEEIAQMNAYVQEVYQVNDAILDTDYYSRK